MRRWQRDLFVCGLLRLSMDGLLYAADATTLYRNTMPGVAYTGSLACAGCHKSIYETFVRTAMGKSIAPALPVRYPLPANARIDSLNRSFEVFEKDGKVFQSETESSAGKSVFTTTQQLSWAIGSGENGTTFAVQRGGYLFEAPLSYYSGIRGWGLSPGYEIADEGFSRPIAEACIVCHAGRARPVSGRDGMYGDPPFAQPAVGCENCHGPGQLHVTEKGRGQGRTPDTSIVNPARLPARLAEDICMMCHQGGQVRALLPGRKYGDFRPGIPLIRTVAIAQPASRSSQADLLEHHESMQFSRCFQAGNGKMGCLTCHDPHLQPDAASAPAYFRAKCLTCHTNSSCSAALTKRKASVPPDNCVACHMPRREVGVIAHSALTDHRIPARPGQPRSNTTAAAAGGIPGVKVFNSREGEPALPLVTRLEILGTLKDADPALTPQYSAILDEASAALPDDALVLAVLGRKALSDNSPDAVRLLSRAEAVETEKQGAARASTYTDLSDALTKAGLTEESAAALERGQALYPWSKEIRKRLVLARITQKDYAKAGIALRQYVADFPEDSFMRGLLNRVEPPH